MTSQGQCVTASPSVHLAGAHKHWSKCKSACRDGTTSTVLLIGELMKQAERYLGEGLHPRVIVEVSKVHGAFKLDSIQSHSLQPIALQLLCLAAHSDRVQVLSCTQ